MIYRNQIHRNTVIVQVALIFNYIHLVHIQLKLFLNLNTAN